ncbi:MAG: hypothetical protein QNL12_05260 [Acidimicrobiia bacterium]|nr:hypothetical protein [Acidimicrobiia bacterium]MDX2466700.1 hypothetical protein [Acidimicrobiia bacterium]
MEAESNVAIGYEAAPGPKDIEAKIAIATARRAVWVGPPIIVVFALFSGGMGAMSAGIGVAIVVANFVLAGFVLSKAARVSLKLYHAAALVGFFLRLTLIMLVMLVTAQVIEVDRLAMGISAVVSYLVLLSWETVAVTRGETKELEWS